MVVELDKIRKIKVQVNHFLVQSSCIIEPQRFSRIIKFFGRDKRSPRLAHFLPVNSQKAMGGNFRQGYFHSHQYSWPEQVMEIDNILANQVVYFSFLPVIFP